MPTLLTFESTLISLWMRQKTGDPYTSEIGYLLPVSIGSVGNTKRGRYRTDHISQPHVKFDENR